MLWATLSHTHALLSHHGLFTLQRISATALWLAVTSLMCAWCQFFIGIAAVSSVSVPHFYQAADPFHAHQAEIRSVGRVTDAHRGARSRSVGRVTDAHISITRCSDEQRDVRERSHRELNATDDKGLIPVRTRDRRLTGGSLEGAYQRRTHAQRTYTVLKTVHRCPEIAPPGRDAARRQATTHAGHTLPSAEYACLDAP